MIFSLKNSTFAVFYSPYLEQTSLNSLEKLIYRLVAPISVFRVLSAIDTWWKGVTAMNVREIWHLPTGNSAAKEFTFYVQSYLSIRENVNLRLWSEESSEVPFYVSRPLDSADINFSYLMLLPAVVRLKTLLKYVIVPNVSVSLDRIKIPGWCKWEQPAFWFIKTSHVLWKRHRCMANFSFS